MNPKHYSQIERAIQCFDKSSTADFLKDNQYLSFVFKKSERFVAALYILTELFPDPEPLKWELRSLGTSIGKDILSFRGRGSIFSKENVGDAFSSIIRAISLLELAHIANLISAMNLSIFRRELDALAAFIEGRGRSGAAMGENITFHEDFFRVPEQSRDEPLAKKGPQSLISETGRISSVVDGIGRKARSDVKDTVLYKMSDTAKGHLAERNNKVDRKQKILDVLRLRDIATIKDFSAVIVGCSEKTVQRELLKLVYMGLIKKDGDRRWSRYSLA